MQKMECRVIFEQAQIIPGMKLVDDGNWLFILVATSNCVYRIQLPLPRQKDRYLLSGLSSSLFDDDQNRFKLPFTDVVLCSSSCVSDSSACFVLALQSGDLAFIKLLERGKGSCNVVKKTSRISKIWSGLNPWAAGEAVECPDDLVICDVMKRDFKAVGICKDHRLRIWSCKRLDCEAQFDITKYQNNNPSVLAGQHHKIRMKCGAAGSCLISVAFSLGLDSVFINFKLDATIPTIQHISTIHCFESANHNLVDYQLTSDRLLWGLWRDADDQPILSVCDITIQTWHEVAMMHSPPSDVSIDPSSRFCSNPSSYF
uniref:Nucleoporin Nup120/160 beta-propeller domain-containing protein n=1 Tax=Ciona savignyi TaxID=51511 RepID=H2ZNJ4_CIOSA